MANPKSITGGVVAAAITPRQAREYSIDLAAALELIDFLYEGGVDGIALLGSTGEFVHFMLEDRARMLDFAVKRSRLPVLVNISHSTLDGTVYLGQEAAGSGVAAVMLMPPYYFRYGQEEIRTFCLRAAEELAKEVPVYLYQIPLFTNPMTAETATELLTTGLFAGIKDSGGDPEFRQAMLRARTGRQFHIFNGDDRTYLEARQAGVDGCISGVACAIPELMARLDRAILANERELAARLHGRALEFLERIRHFPVPVGIKEAARQRKIKTGALACPLGEAGNRDLANFAGWFRDWLPGVLRELK